ncbi:MAG: metallothionein [Verrucomicrobiota bacterium]
MSDTTDNKCACPDCKCEISEGHDVLKDGKHYCSEVCANGHAGDDDGCCDGACNCHG